MRIFYTAIVDFKSMTFCMNTLWGCVHMFCLTVHTLCHTPDTLEHSISF